MAGVLGDYPDGATIDEIAEACGFNVGVVARLLQAMEQGDAARRIPADAEAGAPERWQPGPGKASEVDPNPAPPRCPTCHQVIRTGTPKAATATQRSGGGSGTVNSDGNEPLGRGVLRAWTLEVHQRPPRPRVHPGHHRRVPRCPARPHDQLRRGAQQLPHPGHERADPGGPAGAVHRHRQHAVAAESASDGEQQ